MTQLLSIPSNPLAERTSGHVLLRNISWNTYNAILDEIGDDSTRLTYDHGLLEIEVPSRHHEQLKRFVAEIAEMCMKRLGLDYEPSGSATWRLQDELRGLEADECYHIQHALQVRGKKELDLAVDPPPDLAIEIDITPRNVDKMDIYTTLRVPEIWRVDAEGRCEMTRRDADGSYRAMTTSACIPLVTASLLSHYVTLREEVGHSEALRRFEAEVRGKQPVAPPTVK